MTHTNQQIRTRKLKHYFRKIKRSIPKAYKDKNSVVSNIQQNVDHFLSEFPDASFEDVQQEFGTPAQIITAFFDELPDTFVIDTYHNKKYTLLMFGLISAAIITLLMLHIHDIQTDKAVYIEDTVYIYEETIISE